MAKKDETDFKENLKKKPNQDKETGWGSEKGEEYVESKEEREGSIEGGKDEGDYKGGKKHEKKEVEGKKKEMAKKMGDCAKCGSKKHKTKDHK